jgi:type II secretion system protein H
MKWHRYSGAGFTLIEMIIVLALIALIAAIGVTAFASLDSDSTVTKPSDALSVMVKQANRDAVNLGQPVVIAFRKEGFGFIAGGSGDAEGQFSLGKDTKIDFQRWNGGRKWNSAEGLNWTFYPTGICDALRFRFMSDLGTVEIAYNPLTGSISDQGVYMK